MRVTLIYVAVGVAGFNADRPPGDREGSWIGHGIAMIGAAAKAQGHEVDLIDLRQLKDYDELISKIRANPAQVYGLSVAPVDYPHALQTVYYIKTTLPQAKVIIGGIHPTLFPEEYDFKVIDTVVQGEGEVTFVQLLEQIDNLPKRIQGIKPDLNMLPWVDRELFDYRRELTCHFAPDHQTPSITMLAGRGCPYKCAYCQPAENAVFGKPHRMRRPGDVVREMLYLYDKYSWKSCTFWDDTFTLNRHWIDDFCDNYLESGLKGRLAACSRADIICANEDMIARLAGIGLDWFVIGLETGSQRLLDLIDKGTTVEQNYRAVEICRRHGIKVFATLMYGLPTETREEADLTTRMVQEAAPEFASPFWYTPIPGTRLYDFCAERDLILEEAKGRNIERTGVFIPSLKDVDYAHLEKTAQILGFL